MNTSTSAMAKAPGVPASTARVRGPSGAVSPFDHGTLAQSHCYETPYLLLDAERIRANVAALREAFGLLSPQLFYAVKANPELSVLGLLDEMGCGFDVASLNELRRLTRIGVDPARAVFSSPVKVPGHIAQAYALGVTRFAFDSETELEKIAAHAPGSKVVLRLEVPANGSRWPLAGKFGVPASEAVALLSSARAHGLVPHGLTFHVGSQCLRPESWSDAIAICRDVWRAAAEAGIHLELLNLGGGLPKQYSEDVPELGAIGAEAVRSIAEARLGPGVTYAIEPGRFITADAGAIGTSVIGKATRQGMPWVYVDLSIYSGLLEVIGGWEYPILTPRDGEPRRPTVLAGPTCDSTDVIAREVMLPDLEVGDRLLLLQAGAYTVGYREYNGFDFPAVHVTGAAARTGELLSAVAG